METLKNYGRACEYGYYEVAEKIVTGFLMLACVLLVTHTGTCEAADLSSTTLNSSVGSGSSTGLPWEGPMATLQRSLTGPVAKAIAMIVVVVAGVFVALGEGGPAGRLVGRLVFGLGLLFGALTIINGFMDNQ